MNKLSIGFDHLNLQSNSRVLVAFFHTNLIQNINFNVLIQFIIRLMERIVIVLRKIKGLS